MMVFCYATLGLLASIIGIFTAKVDEHGSPTKALNASTYATTGVFLLLTALATLIFPGFQWRVWGMYHCQPHRRRDHRSGHQLLYG